MGKASSVDETRRWLLAAGPTVALLAGIGATLRAPGARAACDTPQLVYHAQDEGICPDDEAAAGALAALLDTVPAGSVIIFPPGAYDLSGWSGYTLSKSITLLADEGTATFTGPGTADVLANRFVRITESGSSDPVRVIIDGLGFDTWGRTIFTAHTAPIERLSISNCAFNNVSSAVHAYGGDPSADNLRIDYVSVENCRISNTLGNAVAIRALFDTALVTKNRISSSAGSAISVGNTNQGFGWHDDDWKKAIITHNVCTDLITSTSDADIHGIIAAGREILVAHNHIEAVENGGGYGAEGIYLKARYSEVVHNTLIDAGSLEAAITVKGSDREDPSPSSARGYALRICNNTIVNTREGDYRGITTFNSDTMISNNYLEGVSAGIRVGESSSTGGHLISGNLMRDVAGCGIKLYSSGSRAVVSGNSISMIPAENQSGIMLQLISPATVTDWSVQDNTIRNQSSTIPQRRGISIWSGEDKHYPIEGLVIANNQLSELSIGVWSKGSALPVFAENSAWIHDNYFRNCDTDIAFALEAQTGKVIIENNLSG